MNKHAFRPSLNGVLEDRIALSHAGGLQVAVAHPKGHLVLKSTTLNNVNHRIDLAFAQFHTSYSKEITQLDRSGNEARFQRELGVSVNKLKATLDKQAARIPGGPLSLVSALNARVDSLAKDLSTTKNLSSIDLIQSDLAGAHTDVATYVQNEVSKGDFSVK